MINIKIDSRKVEKGDMFVAIKGNNCDGHDFIYDAIENGASFIVMEKDMVLPASMLRLVVPNTLEWLEDYLIKHYKKEIDDVKLIGITGTNGKTTSAYLIYQLLNKLDNPTAYIGTIGYYYQDEIEELPNTTPNILDLYSLIYKSKINGAQTVVMEVSSQGLDMNRTKGLEFDIASITNVTQDHLDYHKTMENYLNAKLKILNQLKNTLIINDDDATANIWKNKFNNFFTYGLYGDISLLSYEDTIDGTIIKFLYKDKKYEVSSKLKGKYNIYNLFNAMGVALNLGYNIEDILNIVPTLNPPKGRCEIIKCNGGIAVVDYAHTPDAVAKIIDTFNENKRGRLITIIGCGGNRDKTKRPIMGSIATCKSDAVIFTDDNPRCEDHIDIMNDILTGVNKSNYEVIYDRREAIVKALDNMNEEDIVLILGKGHEDYQIIGTTKHHFDDAQVVNEYNQVKNKTRFIPR